MRVPETQERTVFYNPVQVQNRDLSILMISLYAERRAIRHAVSRKKKELRKQHHGIKESELQQQLREYESTLDGSQLVLEETKAYPTGLTILDALAASGLRSIRYWKEIPGVHHVTINDLDPAAVERAHNNVQENQLGNVLLESNHDRKKGIFISLGDATHEMYLSRRPQDLKVESSTAPASKQLTMWDVIDLDPYGSAAPFLDAAVQAVENGGLLCITCTDMAALGGSHPETAYGRYGSLPIQSAKYLQELAVRILLYSISVSAAKYGRTLRPILSVGMDFYVRVFVEVWNDKAGVQDLSLNIGNVYQSTRCPTFIVQPHGQMGGKKGNVYQSRRLSPGVCPETGAVFKVGGPLWLGPLHDKKVVTTALERLGNKKAVTTNASRLDIQLLATRERLRGLLTSVSEEIETPLYYQLGDLCRALHCTSPKLQDVMAALHNAGYQVSGYHKEPTAIKTNAPSSVVWDIMRAWVQKNPIQNNKKEPDPESAAEKILSVPPTLEVDFTIPKSFRQKQKVSRFPMNPEKYWGPKRKASGKTIADTPDGNRTDSNKKSKTDEAPAIHSTSIDEPRP